MPDIPANATKSELLEILGQLGIVVYSDDNTLEELYEAVRTAGLSDDVIAGEVREQRGR